MHGKPQRAAYRDFTLWPKLPPGPESDAGRETFKQTQKQQLDHMWDQDSP
jgi:hypothetical protein